MGGNIFAKYQPNPFTGAKVMEETKFHIVNHIKSYCDLELEGMTLTIDHDTPLGDG